MSETNSPNPNEKAAKIRRKPEQESVLSPTFAVARQTNSNNQHHSQPTGNGLLQRQCSCGKHTIAGSMCEECQKKGESASGVSLDEMGETGSVAIQTFPDHPRRSDFSAIPARTITPPSKQIIQPALTVNAPGDQYEQEADQVAEAVMRLPASPMQDLSSFPDPTISRLPSISRIQTNGGSGTFQAPAHVEARINGMQGGGQALPDSERDFFESRMGYDFSRVRVHTDTNAVQASRDIQARAFTIGHNIAFNEGAYQPGTSEGRRLLAHELTHVVQQTSDASQLARAPQELGQGDIQRDLIQRGPIGSWFRTLGHDLAEGVGLESSFEANLGRADAFHDHGIFGPEDLTLGGGGFEASYDPAAGVLRVVMRAAVKFDDALTVSGGTVTPVNATFQAVANRATALPAAQRAAFIAQYQWQDSEKIPWLNQLENTVQTAWGGQFEFFINKPQWEWLGARVQVDIEVHEGDRTDKDHLAINSIKTPPNENLYTHGGFSVTGGGAPGDAFDQTMTLASTDVGARPDTNFLHETVFFGHDSTALDAAAQTTLQRVITRFREAFTPAGAPDPRNNPAKVVLEAHASAPGSETYNLDLARRRAEAVRDFLNNNGFTNVITRVSDDNRGEADANQSAATQADQAKDRRVDLIIDGGQRQVLANHEFGHAFGLGDEYAVDPGPGGIGGTGGPTGTPASHDAMARNMTDATGAHLPGAINQNNGGIMSLGNAVRPQHYATFHAALVELTDINEWALGPRQRRPTAPPSGGTTGS